MKPFVYVITNDPKERCDLVSSVFAQALTALAFGYGCEIFLLDKGCKLIVAGYLGDLKSEAFDPLSVLLDTFREMGGRLYVCSPSLAALAIKKEDCVDVDGYVNASKLFESSRNAAAVFTF
ncbi:MAG: DsrE family protein [Nitrospirota bacterium]|nr:DsrE family protein [Nitrospirota bacterium]